MSRRKRAELPTPLRPLGGGFKCEWCSVIFGRTAAYASHDCDERAKRTKLIRDARGPASGATRDGGGEAGNDSGGHSGYGGRAKSAVGGSTARGGGGGAGSGSDGHSGYGGRATSAVGGSTARDGGGGAGSGSGGHSGYGGRATSAVGGSTASDGGGGAGSGSGGHSGYGGSDSGSENNSVHSHQHSDCYPDDSDESPGKTSEEEVGHGVDFAIDESSESEWDFDGDSASDGSFDGSNSGHGDGDGDPGDDSASDGSFDGSNSSRGDGDGDSGDDSSSDGSLGGNPGGVPWLQDLKPEGSDSQTGGGNRRVVDGDPKTLRFSFDAVGGTYCPYDNRTEAILATFTRLASPSRSLLGYLFQCLRYVDQEGQGINPAHVPESADHFVAKMRNRTPLLRVTEHEVQEKDGTSTTTTLSFAINDILQRLLESPGAVKEMLANPGGHVLSAEDRVNNRIPHHHLTPIATKPLGNRRRGFLHGEIAACSSLVGLDCIVVGPVDKPEEVTIGETVMVNRPGVDTGEEPCRLDSIVWLEASDADDRPSRLVARVNRLISLSEAGVGCEQPDAYAGPKRVWEMTNLGETVEISSIVRRCNVVSDADGVGASPDAPTFKGLGFVRQQSNGTFAMIRSPDNRRQPRPWRQEGIEGVYFNRLAPGVHANISHLPVLAAPLVVFTDAFNFLGRGTSNYSVNATYFCLGNTTRALRRRLRSWFLCSAGAPRAQWQQELDPFFAVIGMLQKGCRARLRVDDSTIEVMVRMGVIGVNTDSPVHSSMTNTKRSSSSTKKPCSACNIGQANLGDGQYNVKRNRRTPDGIDHSLDRVRNEQNHAKKEALSTKLGVVDEDAVNPVRRHVHCNVVRQFGTDIFHQDAINCSKRYLKFFVGGLSKHGKPLIASRARDPTLRIPGTEPIKDIVREGGWASQTGMDVWRLGGVSLLLFRPILCDVESMRKFLTRPFLKGVMERLDTDDYRVVLEELRALLRTASVVTHTLRSSSFDNADLSALDRGERTKVSLMGKVMGKKNGGKLGTIHQGLHIAENIRDLGEPVNTHTGESLHKGLKSFAASCKGGDNIPHIMRRQNARMAAECMEEGLRWEARAYDRAQQVWVTKTIEAGPDLVKLLRSLAEGQSRTREHGIGRPRGVVEWRIDDVVGDGTEAPLQSEAWKNYLETTIRGMDLMDLYHTWFGCGRGHTDDRLCQDTRCPRCWKWRNMGLMNKGVRCISMWAGAPADVSAGTGTLRGCPVQDAAADGPNWMLAPAPYGTDVELYCTREALRADVPGATGICTLAKVAFFVEHEGNPSQDRSVGEKTMWVAVAEYVTAGPGNTRSVDPATGHAVLKLRRNLSFSPADAIRRVVHMFHRCPRGACAPRRQRRGTPIWSHKLTDDDSYLHNEHFHSVK